MSAQPMQAHSLCIAIADKLRERILSHQLPPGSDINDGALAQEFGVSRTPVREAMKLLCHEGLLSAQPRRGMSVTCLSAAQVAEARLLSKPAGWPSGAATPDADCQHAALRAVAARVAGPAPTRTGYTAHHAADKPSADAFTIACSPFTIPALPQRRQRRSLTLGSGLLRLLKESPRQ